MKTDSSHHRAHPTRKAESRFHTHARRVNAPHRLRFGGLRLVVRVSGVRFRESGVGCRVLVVESRFSGFGFRVSAFGFRDSGLRCRVLGFGCPSFGVRVSGFGFSATTSVCERCIKVHHTERCIKVNTHTKRFIPTRKGAMHLAVRREVGLERPRRCAVLVPPRTLPAFRVQGVGGWGLGFRV